MKKRGILRERIIRILLNNPEGKLSKYSIAKLAESSFPWVHELLSNLEKEGMVEKTKVTNYGNLLSFFQKIRIIPNRRYYMHKNPEQMLERTRLKYALTTYKAEQLVQNYLFPSRYDIYVIQEDEKRWHEMISSQGLVGRGNVRLLLADEHVLDGSFESHGLRIVSLPQLIVDLFEEGGVCVEAAEKLRKKVVEENVSSK